MNFLAHFYLSDNNPDLVTGNFLGDMMRKSEWKNLPNPIRLGILQHHEIDRFTDSHEIVKNTKEEFLKEQKLFSGVVLDIFMDYFLAKNWNDYHTDSLDEYSLWVYNSLANNTPLFNRKAELTFDHMQKNNWLVNYASFEGIGRILYGMSRRTKHENKIAESISILKEKETQLEHIFNLFFIDLKKNSQASIDKLRLVNNQLE